MYISVLRIKRADKALEVIRDNLLISLSWVVGLCGTVLIKQALAYAVLGEQTGIEQLEMRMGSNLTMEARLISVFDGIMDRLSDPLVMVVIFAVIAYLLCLLWSGRIKRVKGISALFIIAIYPVVWWFLLAGHSTHGYVIYIYGVTYYALLSAVCVHCTHIGGMQAGLKSCRAYMSGGRLKRAVCGLCVCAVVAYCFLSNQFFYNEKEYAPWSTDIESFAELGNGAEVVQEMQIEIEKYSWVKLLGISTILVNMTDDTSGVLDVKIMLGDELIDEAQVNLDDVQAGEYFDIPVNAILYLGYDYKIVYSLLDGTDANPYLCIQPESQVVGVNDDLYVNGQLTEGGIVNKYVYKTERIFTKSKVSMLLILFFAVQYVLCERLGNGKAMLSKEGAYEG